MTHHESPHPRKRQEEINFDNTLFLNQNLKMRAPARTASMLFRKAPEPNRLHTFNIGTILICAGLELSGSKNKRRESVFFFAGAMGAGEKSTPLWNCGAASSPGD
jgi:hypothetical protein